jgi:group I intron endonuclease
MLLNINKKQHKKYFLKKEKSGVLYKITNLINNQCYIGSSCNLVKRYYTHLNHIRTNKQSCTKLVRAVNKYKEDNFKFEIIAECPKEYVLKLEQWFIDNVNPEYNICKIAGNTLGTKRTQETKIKKSTCQKEKWKNTDYRAKHLENLSKNWRSGILHKMAKLTEEQVINIKKLLKEGFRIKQISDKLNVSYYSVQDISRGKTWKTIII